VVLDNSIFSSGTFLLARKTRIMKVKIKLGDQEKEVEISGLKRKHARDWLRKMRVIAEKVKVEDLSSV